MADEVASPSALTRTVYHTNFLLLLKLLVTVALTLPANS